MDRVRLEPTSVARAAARLELQISEMTVGHICALLQNSRGITLIGEAEKTRRLARAIANAAAVAGFAGELFTVRPESTAEVVIERLRARDWLFFGAMQPDLVEGLLHELGRVLAIREESLPEADGVTGLPDTWRAIIAHQPTVHEPLPLLSVSLRRHFPWVEVT